MQEKITKESDLWLRFSNFSMFDFWLGSNLKYYILGNIGLSALIILRMIFHKTKEVQTNINVLLIINSCILLIEQIIFTEIALIFIFNLCIFDVITLSFLCIYGDLPFFVNATCFPFVVVIFVLICSNAKIYLPKNSN